MADSLPCIKFDCPCPYADKTGKTASWLCYGVRPAVRVIFLKECPQIEVARAEYVKQKRGGHE